MRVPPHPVFWHLALLVARAACAPRPLEDARVIIPLQQATCLTLQTPPAPLEPGAMLPRRIVLFDSLPATARWNPPLARGPAAPRAEWREGSDDAQVAAGGMWRRASHDSTRSLQIALRRESDVLLILLLRERGDSVAGELQVMIPDRIEPLTWPVHGHRRRCRLAAA